MLNLSDELLEKASKAMSHSRLLIRVTDALLTRLLPQVEAKAACSCNNPWEHEGCCGTGGSQWLLKKKCLDDNGTPCSPYYQYLCTGICPT